MPRQRRRGRTATLTPLELPPPGTYTPYSDADHLAAMQHLVRQALRIQKRWGGALLLAGALLGVLGFRAAGPGARLDALEERLAAVDTLRTELQDVKIILCASAQPTGQLAAEKCLTSSRRTP